MSWLQIITMILGSSVVATITSKILDLIFQKRGDTILKANMEKRESYKIFTDLIFGILSKAKNPSEIDTKSLENTLYKFYSVFVLYGSPSTIKKVGCFMQNIFYTELNPDADKLKYFDYLGDILLSMRKDLGLDNKGLSKTEFFRLFLKDYEKIFEKRINNN